MTVGLVSPPQPPPQYHDASSPQMKRVMAALSEVGSRLDIPVGTGVCRGCLAVGPDGQRQGRFFAGEEQSQVAPMHHRFSIAVLSVVWFAFP